MSHGWGTWRPNALTIQALLVIGCALVASPAFAQHPIDSPWSLLGTAIANVRGAIGSAEMEENGVIHLHICPPIGPMHEWSSHSVIPLPAPQERIGYGEIDIGRMDPLYDELLRHLGGLKPGETKPIMPWKAGEQWHCALDPYRGPCPLQHLLPGTITQL